MCISLEASIAAFVIGESSAAYMLSNGHRLGFFIGVYTLIQLVEAGAYAGADGRSVSRALILLVAAQSPAFVYSVWPRLRGVVRGVAATWAAATMAVGVWGASVTKDATRKNERCTLDWSFWTESAVRDAVLIGQYPLILALALYVGESVLFAVLGSTLVASFIYTAVAGRLGLKFVASPWCLSSAVAAPIVAALSTV